MKVIEFKYFDSCDNSISNYFDGHCWSRPYEYCKVENLVREYLEVGSKIHNTSWGFEGPHVQFKDCLDSFSTKSIHTDIRPSTLKNTDVYDITQEPRDDWVEAFDAVINISTVEEVPFDHVTVIQNLLKMVKSSGYLFITFDLPGLQIQKVEEFIGATIEDTDSRLSGVSSKYPNLRWKNLNCGYLVIKK